VAAEQHALSESADERAIREVELKASAAGPGRHHHAVQQARKRALDIIF